MKNWKKVKNFENEYIISEYGEIQSLERLSITGKKLKSKLIKPHLVGDGYLQVTLIKNGKRSYHLIHCLVADNFLKDKRNGRELVVDHIDNNKLNNHYSNLQIVSQRINNSKDRTGTSKYTGVSLETSTGKWRSEIRISGKNIFLGRFNNEKEAYEAYEKELSKM